MKDTLKLAKDFTRFTSVVFILGPVTLGGAVVCTTIGSTCGIMTEAAGFLSITLCQLSENDLAELRM